jgi:E3 ubiquitin-protein ligase synoviolin
MGLPMHIIRDVYLTFASFVKRVQDYNNYRKATQNMNSRYPDATSEELTNDNTCIVCREVMVPWSQPDAAGQAPRPSLLNEGMRAKKLPCGHILHLRCLKAWLERQQACPTCRRPVIPTGTSATDRAGAGNQNADAGANGGAQQGANAQAGAPNAENGNGNRPAQPRLRMLNLGPIRIGVYNGPANRVRDALNQRRAQDNGNATGTATPAANPGIGGLAGARSMDTQLQLLQVEEHLMQESRRLMIEQTQLATVRALEAELARLRAYHSHNQAGNRAPNTPAGVRPVMPNFFPNPSGMPPGVSFAQPQVFQPGPGQAPMTQGHEGLPPGLVLPEGWTLAPLNRVEGTTQFGGGMPQTEAPVPTPTVVVPEADVSAPAQEEGTEQTMASSILESQPAEHGHPAQESASEVESSGHPEELSSLSPQQGPSSSAQAEQPTLPNIDSHVTTPEEVSVDASVDAPTEALVEPSAEASLKTSADTSAEAPAQSDPSPLTTQSNGWGESSSWNFDNVDGGDSSTQQTSSEEQPIDKGKGRAVTVEDVEDAEQ